MADICRSHPEPNFRLHTGLAVAVAFMFAAASISVWLFVAPPVPPHLNFWQAIAYSPAHGVGTALLAPVPLVLLWGQLQKTRYSNRIHDGYCKQLEPFSSDQLREWESQLFEEMDPEPGSPNSGMQSKEIACIWQLLDARNEPTVHGR